MSIQQLPENLKAIIRNGVKLIGEEYPAYPGMCENCGGLGYIYAFAIESGPYRDVPGNVPKGSVIKSIDDPMTGWAWYIGKTASGACPVCKTIGRVATNKPIKQYNTAGPIRRLAEHQPTPAAQIVDAEMESVE
jgi:hypothetical protein